jgi:hypothetical protein
MTIKTEEIGMPGFGPALKAIGAGYEIRYCKANLDDPTEATQAETIMTRAIDGTDEIVLLGTDKFTFMDKYFLVIQYMEKRNDRSQEAQ